jgi:hypothetical protein
LIFLGRHDLSPIFAANETRQPAVIPYMAQPIGGTQSQKGEKS